MSKIISNSRMFGKTTELFLRESNAIEDVFDEDSYMQAKYAWEYLLTENELTPGVILKTHKILMLHSHLMPDERGYYRRIDVMVGGHIKMDWRQVPFEVRTLTERIRLIADFPYTKKDLETMSQSLHIQYENIHPFVDGNGRTGRMFMNWWRIKRGLPILIIKASERQEYYKWFN